AALRTPLFWVFTLSAALFNLMWSAITLFSEPLLNDHGLGHETFVLVQATLPATGLPANLAGGWLAGRHAVGRVLAAGMLFFGASLLAFPFVTTPAGAVAYGLVLGAAGGIITVVYFTAYGHAFGRTHLGKIQAAVQVVSVFASALGPLLLAFCKERTDSYHPLFFVAAPVALSLAAFAWQVPGSACSRKTISEEGS